MEVKFMHDNTPYITQGEESMIQSSQNVLREAVNQKMKHIRYTLGRTNLSQWLERYFISKDENICFKLDADVMNELKHCSDVEIIHAIGKMKKRNGKDVFFHFKDDFFLFKSSHIIYLGKYDTIEEGKNIGWGDLDKYENITFLRNGEQIVMEQDMYLSLIMMDYEKREILRMRNILNRTNACTLLISFAQGGDKYKEIYLSPPVYASLLEHHEKIDNLFMTKAIQCPSNYCVGMDKDVVILKKDCEKYHPSYMHWTMAFCFLLPYCHEIRDEEILKQLPIIVFLEDK